MNVYINDFEVDKSLIYFNTGLNFGRFDFDGIQIDNYKITLSVAEFIGLIEADYNKIRDEIKLDDEVQDETSPFTAISYGTITELLQNKESLQEIITTYLDTILFGKLFLQTKNPGFIINSTDLVAKMNNQIEISGRSYRKK